MSNQSLFIAAAEKTPDAIAQLASLTVKLAGISTVSTRQGIVDPLDNPEFGPERASNSVGRGRNIGKLVGTVGGAALGGLAGHALGGGVLSAATNMGDAVGRHLPWYDADVAHDVHDSFTNFGNTEGTISGGLVGGLVGHAVGGGVGAGLGKVVSNFASPESQAAERIKKMDPATGLAHIHMMEQSGHASPSVIQAMKDTYEVRRRGLQAQIQSGVPVRA